MDYNSIENVNKIQQEAVKKVKAYARPKTFFAIIELIACAILSMGIELIGFGFDFSKFSDPTFYFGSLGTLAGILLVFRATINAVYYKTSQRESVLKAKEDYKKENDKKELDLKTFLEKYNKDRKIQLYIENINVKIFKYEKKRYKTVNPRKIAKYDKIIDNLKMQITTEYIVEHIDRIPIKQDLVYYSDFNELDNPVSSEIKTRADYDGALNKATFNKIWWYIVTTILLGVGISTSRDGGVINLIVSTSLTAFMTIYRICRALQQADIIYDSTITKSYIDRTEILKQYFIWKAENPDLIKKEREREIEAIKEELRIEYEQKAKEQVRLTLEKINSTKDNPIA